MPAQRRKHDSLPPWAREATRAIDLGLVALVVVSPLLIGGLLPAGQVALSAAAVGILAVTFLTYLGAGQQWQWDSAASVLVLAAALTLVRATPLGGLFAGDTERTVFALWPGLPLLGTVAPGRAPLAALQFVGIAAIVQIAAVRLRRSGGSARATQIVLGTWGLVALTGLAHAATAADRMFGVYEPLLFSGLLDPIAAPFVNENQSGALWALAAVVALGAARLQRVGQRRTAFLVLGFAAIGVLFVAMEAHAAELACGVGVAVLAIGAVVSRSRWRHYDRSVAAASALALLIVLVTVYVVMPSGDGTGSMVEKTRIWRDAWALTARAPFFGYGPGAFPDVYPSVAGQVRIARFAYAESMPVQFIVDHGYPLAVLFLIALGRSLGRRGRSQRRHDTDVRAVILAILVTVAIEAVGGMGLVALGYAFPVAVLYGTLAGQSARRRRPSTHPVVLLGAAVWFGVAAGSLPGLSDSVRLGALEVQVPAMSGLDVAAPRDPELDAELHRLAALAPASPAVIGAAAWIDILRGDLDAAAPRVDYLSAHAPGWQLTWDIDFEYALARGELRRACAAIVAMEPRIHGTPDLLAEQLRRVDDDVTRWLSCFDDPRAIAPAILRSLVHSRAYSEALALATARLADEPDDEDALVTAAEALTGLGIPELAADYARRIEALDEASAMSHLRASRTFGALGDQQARIGALNAAIDRHPDDDRLRIERLVAFAAAESFPGSDEDLLALFVTDYTRLRRHAATNDGIAARRYRAGARVFERTGMLDEAARALHGVLRHRPDDPWALEALARIYTAQGRESAAQRYRERAAYQRQQ